MVRLIYMTFAAVMLAVLLPACDATIHEYPNLVNDEIEVRIVLNTDGVSNVTSDIYNGTLPKPSMTSEMMRVLFYAPESGRMVSQCFISQKSVTSEGREMIYGRTNLPPGDYIMLAYNFDIETVLIENENDLSEIIAFTPEIPDYLYRLFRGQADSKVFRQPEHLMVARRNVRIEETDRPQIIEAEARTVIDTYYIQIRVRGLEHASTAIATLSGMSPSNRFGMNERNMEDTKIMFDLSGNADPHIADDNKDVLCALFNTFGKVDAASKLTVRFDIITHDGTQFVKTLVIDPVFITDDARLRHWLLIDYVLDIPEPRHQGGGFDPTTTKWDEIHDSIEIW